MQWIRLKTMYLTSSPSTTLFIECTKSAQGECVKFQESLSILKAPLGLHLGLKTGQNCGDIRLSFHPKSG